MKYFLSRIIVLGLLLTSSVSQAALTINITQGVEGALPIAVVPFKWLGPGPLPATDVAAIVSADLYRSGRFSPLPDEDFLAYPYKKGQVNFKDWRLLGVDNLVIGRVKAVGESYVIEFQLFDVYGGEQITGYIIRAEKHELRYKAHQISDIIYEALTGTPGAFATRIAYVTHIKNAPSARRYSLQVADADGFNPQPVLNSKEPLMSPAWSPDGSRLAYVSFEDGRPSIYIQNVSTGQRELITSFTGINGAPSWSPDGKQLAVVLSKGGNPDIYTLDLATRRLKQRTRHYAIDTEPVWTRDGKGLIFTSDRGGRPQLYQLSFSSGKAKRLTFEGRYNARATVSPDGKNVAMVYADNGNFQIAVMELETGFLRVLTDAKLDESPSFSPNGSMIIYATVYGDRGILSAVSVDGRVRQRLMLQVGDAREPVWSPYHDAQ